MRSKTYYVYIMASRSLNLYTGITNSLYRRALQHKRGDIGGDIAPGDPGPMSPPMSPPDIPADLRKRGPGDNGDMGDIGLPANSGPVTCAACGEPMSVIEPGQITHPTCGGWTP